MPRPKLNIPAGLGLAAALLGASLAASAQDSGDRKEAAASNLERLQQQIEEKAKAKADLEKSAEEAAAEAARLSAQLVGAARDIRLTEENALRLETRIADLEVETSRKKDQLGARREELLKLLSALERLSQRPAAFALLQPSEALTTARSASLMGNLVPEINRQATTLREELGILASLQDALSRERFSLKNTLAELTQHQLKLGSLLERRKAEAERATSEAGALERELADFARKARSLQELVDKLEQQSAKLKTAPVVPVSPGSKRPLLTPSRRPMAQMKGSLPFPAIGPIVKHFGDVDGVGHIHGIKIKARTSAQIVAPYDGQVVFAGPFRNYGQLLIIAHGDGYHSLLAGLSDLQSVVGQWVLTGEPVGVMGNEANVTELYMELRHNGTSVDPTPWLSRQTAAAR